MAKARACKDANGDVKHLKRPAPHPGPRCATCHRTFTKAAKKRAHDAHVVRTYKVASGFYELMVAFQDGRCAICQRATGASKRLATDHRHADNLVRGALCSTCNEIIGYWGDDPAVWLRGYFYLIDPPAVRLALAMGM